ncbi:MAG: hypothetical protein AMXMBFR64_63150 [Myxococcales bacterium]
MYVRQSTAAQVQEHVESTQRQYALVERAVALGWEREQVEVVDEDQGRSGKTTEGRSGFVRLAHEVAHGRAGAVLAIEVSRLARSSQDWQRLLSLCAVARAVVIDEQSIYDPAQHDDKLLLDLKGAMSEQELHWLRLRLAGGRLNKARRGEAHIRPPAGYVWGGRGLELDPDESVRTAVQLLFERFAVEPSARAVVRWARDTGFRLPTRDRTTGQVTLPVLGSTRLCDILHNPIYAGVYVFGRRPTREVLIDGEVRKVRVRLDDRAEWPVAIDAAHPAYITWERYVSNQEKLRNNSAHLPAQGAPREGGALLAGLLLCGRCGRRMSPHYESVDHARSRWIYQCHQEDEGVRVRCWSVTGPRIDAEIESLFLSMMVPGEIELSLAVERETDRQAESLEKAWRARLEQARFEARTAERRYMAVDPDNRVVARTLEAQWEQRLRDLATVERQLQDARTSHKVQLNDADRARIRELARDLPAIWRSATTAVADRKAMLRIAIEVISARPVEIPTRSTRLEVQWHTGTTSSVVVPRFRRGEYKKTHASVEDQVRDLAAAGTHDAAIAEELNRLGHRNGAGGAWTVDNIRHLRGSRRIPRVAPDLLRMPPLPPRDASGRYSVPGAATRMGVTEDTVYRWIRQGRVTSIRADHGTHRAPYWIELDDAVEARLRETMRGGRPKKSVD